MEQELSVITLRMKSSIKNISKAAYIKTCVNPTKNTFLGKEQKNYYLAYRFEYTNRWGYDMSETRIQETHIDKSKALEVLENRSDLKKELEEKGVNF